MWHWLELGVCTQKNAIKPLNLCGHDSLKETSLFVKCSILDVTRSYRRPGSWEVMLARCTWASQAVGVWDRRSEEGEQGEEKAGRNWSEWVLILNIQHYQQQLHLVLLRLAKKTSTHSIYFIWKGGPNKLMNKHHATQTPPYKPPRKQEKQWSTKMILSFLSPVNRTPTLWAHSDSLVKPDALLACYSLLLPLLDVAKLLIREVLWCLPNQGMVVNGQSCERNYYCQWSCSQNDTSIGNVSATIWYKVLVSAQAKNIIEISPKTSTSFLVSKLVSCAAIMFVMTTSHNSCFRVE